MNELTQARLQELRAEHVAMLRGPKEGYCFQCGVAGGRWPCEDSQVLDLALEAERLRIVRDMYVSELEAQQVRINDLRAALASIAANTCCEGCGEVALVARSALAGTEAEDD